MTATPQTFTFTTSDPNQLLALATGLANYNANNPQNQLAGTEAFFSLIVNATINQKVADALSAEETDAISAMQSGNMAPMQALVAQEQAEQAG